MLFTLLVTLLALGQLSLLHIAGAPTASADSVWYQSYGRSSASEDCQAQPDDVPWQASWGPYANWEPSWEQWPNGGLGGWVCSRSITWARSAPPAPPISDIPTSVTAIAGDAQATISWVAPVVNPDSPITSYTAIAVGDDTKTCTTPDGTTTTCTITGLTNGTTYTFTVSATSTTGTSAQSLPSPAVTPSATATVPDAPTSATAVAGDAEATITWTAPADGGSPITSYTAEVVGDDSKTCTTADGTTTTCTVAGLTNDTAYTFTVTATNSLGASTPSAPSNSVTPVLSCANGAPCSLGDIGPGGGLVFLIDSGLFYEFAPQNWSGESETKGDWCNVTTSIPAATGTAIGSGASNTAAIDATCTSGASQRATDYAGGGLTDWFLPSKAELEAVYTYSQTGGVTIPVAFDFGGGGYWSSSQDEETTAWVRNLEDGRQWSSTKSVDNNRPRPIRAGRPITPAAPTSASATAGDAEATITWTAPVASDTSPITSYTVEAVGDDSKSCTTPDATTTTCTVTGLTNDTAYTFTVTSNNGIGASAPSTPSNSVTPVLSCANGAPCSLGDIGPGGGLVFLISGGKTYEMAPQDWSGESETKGDWCNVTTSIAGATGTAVGTGKDNTAAMDAACTSGAGQRASDYDGGGLTDWFLPSKGELGEMYSYGNSTTLPAGFTFGSGGYWSSSQVDTTKAWVRNLEDGSQWKSAKDNTNIRPRPIRSF